MVQGGASGTVALPGWDDTRTVVGRETCKYKHEVTHILQRRVTGMLLPRASVGVAAVKVGHMCGATMPHVSMSSVDSAGAREVDGPGAVVAGADASRLTT